MATRKRRSRSDTSSLTGAQAQYVITQLLKTRRISEREVQAHLGALSNEIEMLEAQLSTLRSAASGPQPASRRGTETGVRKRRRQNLSPERRAALQRQGHYLALMRQVPKYKRAGFTKIFKTKGGDAAISALKKLLGK